MKINAQHHIPKLCITDCSIGFAELLALCIMFRSFPQMLVNSTLVAGSTGKFERRKLLVSLPSLLVASPIIDSFKQPAVNNSPSLLSMVCQVEPPHHDHQFVRITTTGKKKLNILTLEIVAFANFGFISSETKPCLRC